MGIRILEGTYDGHKHAAALVDSVTDTVFGPLFDSAHHAECFLEWLRDNVTNEDARKLSSGELALAHDDWRKECLDEDGDFLSDDAAKETEDSRPS